MSARSTIKKVFPPNLRRGISLLLNKRRERRLSRLSAGEAFDEIYRRGIWKIGNAQSGPGSEGSLADRYVELVLSYAARHNLRTVVDGGCGDFSIGSRLAPNFVSYLAVDVSPMIIEMNKQRYASFFKQHAVAFAMADLTSTVLKRADLILIRQVLQHLTNSQVELVLRNLEAADWRRVLITEEVQDSRNCATPNLDLPSHTFNTRVALRSGVFIDREPFNRSANRIATIEEEAVGERPRTNLLVFELTRDSIG
jgi:hypothetical protein